MKYLIKLCLLAAVFISSGNTKNGAFEKLYSEDHSTISSKSHGNPFDYTADNYNGLIPKMQGLGSCVIGRSSKELNEIFNILRNPDGLSFSIGKLWGLIGQSPLPSLANEILNEFRATISQYHHRGSVVLSAYIAQCKYKAYCSAIFTGVVKGIPLSSTAIISNTLFDHNLFKFPRPSNMVDQLKGKDWHLVIKELIVWRSIVLWSDFP